MSSREYRPEIDGLRALAVIPVLLFHLGFEWIPGGFLGVDVFFVISGFLITSIVLTELQNGTFTFREFWSRRIRRIFPPLILVVGCTLLATWILTPRFDHKGIAQQCLAALLSVANVYFWRSAGDYWGLDAEQMPLLHTWSLSVEEQFYLLFPIALWLIHRWRPAWLAGSLAVTAVASFCLFLYGLHRSPTATFYLLPTRAWELAVGCSLAALPHWSRPSTPAWSAWRSGLACVGLGAIMTSYCLLPALNAGVVVTVLGAAAVLACADCQPCRTILSAFPLVYVGKASYSLYLWHWPFLTFAQHPNVQLSPWLAFGLSCLAAIVSYECIEKPTRRRPGMLPVIGAGYVATLAGAGLLLPSRGAYDTSAFNRPVTHSYRFDIGDHDGAGYRAALARAGATYDLPPPDFPADAWRSGGIIVGPDQRPAVVVIGDSHGTMWSHVIEQAVARLGVTASFYASIGIPPFGMPHTPPAAADALFDRHALNTARLEAIERWQPTVVMVCVRWSNYSRDDVIALMGFLQQHARRTLLLEQPPELLIVNRDALQWLSFSKVQPEIGREFRLPQGNRRRYERGRALIREVALEFQRCDVIPVYDLYCRDSSVLVLDGKDVLYIDDDHLTERGTARAAVRIEHALADALSKGRLAADAAPSDALPASDNGRH